MISSVELDDWKIILHAAWEIKQHSSSDLSPKHLICTKCSTSCSHVPSRIGPNPCCKSAGKRRRKRFSSQVISSVELDDWKIILHAAWEIKQHSSSDLSPKHLICTKCSTSCCHVPSRIGPNPHCKSAGKRRRKRFSSQVISSVELDDWKIILHAAWEIKQHSSSDLSPKHLICTKCSTSCCHVPSRIGPNPHCKSAGKRRRKRFSSQVISSVELDDWKIILHAAWEIKQHSSSDLSPKHLICTKCSTSCCHVPSRIGPNPHCKSAGKRRRKRFSSQVISSVELDDWKIILLASIWCKDLQPAASLAPSIDWLCWFSMAFQMIEWWNSLGSSRRFVCAPPVSSSFGEGCVHEASSGTVAWSQEGHSKICKIRKQLRNWWSSEATKTRKIPQLESLISAMRFLCSNSVGLVNSNTAVMHDSRKPQGQMLSHGEALTHAAVVGLQTLKIFASR